MNKKFRWIKTDTFLVIAFILFVVLFAGFFPPFFLFFSSCILFVALVVCIIKIFKNSPVFTKILNFSYWNKLPRKKKRYFFAICLFFPILGLAIYLNRPHQKKYSYSLFAWTLVWFGILSFFLRLPILPEETFKSYYRANYPTYSIEVEEYVDEELISNPEKQSENTTAEPSTNSSINSSLNTTSNSTSIIEPSTGDDSESQSALDSEPVADVMSGIVIAEAENVSYSRNEYQPNWNVGSGCNIRSRLLSTFSLISTLYSSNNCTVIYGSWNDPYTGRILTGNPYQGDGTENDLDIDHIIPLKYVNSHGGYYWSAGKKREYGSSLAGMEKGIYIAVSASENRKKSDSGPSEYYPPSSSFRCEYSKRWRDIAREYSISLSRNDYEVIKEVLIACEIN